MDERLRSRVEEIVEEKVEESLKGGADSEISKIVGQKVEEKLEDRKKTAEKGLGLVEGGDMDRRSFLKMLGLGGAGLGLAASGAAKLNIRDNTDFFGNIDTNGNTITDSTGQPVNINADTVDGKHASDLGTDLTNLSSSYNVQSVSDSVGVYQNDSSTKTDSTTVVSVSGSGWVLSGKYSRGTTTQGFRASASSKVNMNIDGNSFTNFSSGIIPAFYFDSSFSIDLSVSASAGGSNYTFASANASASVKYIT